MKNDTQDLTTGVVWKKLLRFFFPILVGLLFQQLYNTADAVIVGHFLGDNAMAAVGGSVSVITNLILGFFTGLNSGATVLISQYYGANDRENLSKSLHTCALFSAAVGLVITVGGYFLAPFALRLVNNPEDIMQDSLKYLRIYLTGSVPLLAYNLFQGTLQAVGDSRRPLVYLIISCVTNICLDWLFVGAFGWGVAGVAWASVTSMVLCMALALIHLVRSDSPHAFRFKKLAIDPGILVSFLKIGLPSGVQSSMYSISNLIIQAAVNGFGIVVCAAWTASGKVDGFYWVTTNAFGVAICAFAGQCYGAGKLDRMKQAMRSCMKISLSVTACLSVFLLTVGYRAYPLFLKDRDVIDTAYVVMLYIVPYYIIWSYIEVLTGTLRGSGDTFVPMIIVMLGTCVFRVIWMLVVVPRWHTVPGVTIVYGISWAITAVAFTIYYAWCCRNGFKNSRKKV